jgi:ElaB/YqjD/DUF883 family membrane-anchored ribosome-binding protein
MRGVSKLAKDMNKKIEQLQDRYDDLKNSMRKFERHAEGRIKESPVKSVLVAAGIGAVIGAVVSALIGRRR